jgi:hypothetical protein
MKSNIKVVSPPQALTMLMAIVVFLCVIIRVNDSSFFQKQRARNKLRAMGADVILFGPEANVVLVSFGGSTICLDGIEQFESIRELNFSATKVNGKQLSKLSKLNRLKILDLSHTQIGDSDFHMIPTLPELTYLRIDHTFVTAAILSDLKKFPGLKGVDLAGTLISEDEAIRQPDLRPSISFAF